MRDTIPAILMLLAAGFGLAVTTGPAPGQSVIVAFAPGIGPVEAVTRLAAADGDWRVAAIGVTWPLTVLALAPAGTSPLSLAALRRTAGLWATLRLPAGRFCLLPNTF